MRDSSLGIYTSIAIVTVATVFIVAVLQAQTTSYTDSTAIAEAVKRWGPTACIQLERNGDSNQIIRHVGFRSGLGACQTVGKAPGSWLAAFNSIPADVPAPIGQDERSLGRLRITRNVNLSSSLILESGTIFGPTIGGVIAQDADELERLVRAIEEIRHIDPAQVDAVLSGYGIRVHRRP